MSGFQTAEAVRRAVSMSDAIAAVREAFVGFTRDEFELPLRTVMRDGAFLAMNAHHRASGSAVVKSVSLDFGRRPAVQGVVAYLSLGAGPTVTMDAGSVTSLRTGAVVGVATDLLAPVDASVLTLVGLGGQAPDQLRAVRAVRDISAVRLVGATPDEALDFRDRLAEELADVDVSCYADIDEAVSEADVVCCATPSTQPLFKAESLPARVHVNAIGAFRLNMRELPDQLLADALVVVDQREAAMEEAGDVVHAIEAGLLKEDSLVELGHALTDGVATPPRTVFKSVGLAIQDWAVARAVALGSSSS
jgi:ornithine cyclodeaminase/alanine dehydrogenase-like protein (mu-crystallin family)